MLELSPAPVADPTPSPARPPFRDEREATPPSARGGTAKPQPEAPWSAPLRWLAAVLDELDYGMVLLSEDGRRPLHVNESARAALGSEGPLQVVDGLLSSRQPADRLALRAALNEVANRGLRRLVRLGERPRQTWAALVPLKPDEHRAGAVLMVLGKAAACESLSIAGFARVHQLTATEMAVLAELCAGAMPKEIARNLGIAISTVRTHVNGIRTKTGASSIRALVADVASLPPLKGILRQVCSSAD